MLLSIVKWAIGIVITLIGAIIFFPAYPFTCRTIFPYWLTSFWARAIVFISGSRVKVVGRQNIFRNQSYIFCCNHQSYFDIYILLGYLPYKVMFISKETVFKVPLIGWAMKALGYIPLDRSNPRKALLSIRGALKQLEKGYSLILFPEGTRSTDGRVQEFKSGSMRLAFESASPVVPVSIYGSGKIQSKGSMEVKGQNIGLVIGKPMKPKSATKAERSQFLKQVREVIIENLDLAEAAVTVALKS
jgi:1-acyl-sn-glycerol-3-phosphate acyltransferase